MAATTGTKIVKDGLVLNIDAANVGKNAGLTSVQYLIVAGGGGGGSKSKASTGGGTAGGAGGGAGGLLQGIITVTPQSNTITVGAGGHGGGFPSGVGTTQPGGNGDNSSALGLIAIGGGGGARNGGGAGSAGGSGGGAASVNGGGGAGTAGQGNDGGNAVIPENSAFPRSGGGGAGSPGGNAVNGVSAGAGGIGLASDISGIHTFYAGGGGGSWRNGSNTDGAALGGAGGGANGGIQSGSTIVNGFYGENLEMPSGAPNTGGGGGGQAGSSVNLLGHGGFGGSGIVIIRYPGPQRAVGGTVTRVGNDTVHTYTTVGSSTFTPLTYTNNTAFTAVPDLSNNGNIGTAANGPVYNSDNGGAFVFDGVNDHCLLPNIIFEKPFTINFLCSVTQIKNQGFYSSRTVVGKGISIFALVSNSIRFDTGDDQWTPGYNIPLNENVNLTFVVDENSKKIFVNGILQNSKSFTAQINDISQNIATIGCSQVNGDSFGNFINGKISFFHVYNRALTAAEIAENFEAARGRYGI